MKKIIFLLSLTLLNGCSSLSYTEETAIRNLATIGITVEKPVARWKPPANEGAAGALNLLPGVGNFYLGTGKGAEKNHYLYGFLNLITWPVSILWGVPEAFVDAQTINKRELVYYYTYDPAGINLLHQNRLQLLQTGEIRPF